MKKIDRKIKIFFKKIIRTTFWMLLLLVTAMSAYSIQFSEILYNPAGSDAGREWIELSNPECENLETYKLLENGINHNIRLYSEGICDYPIICNDCGLFLNEYNVASQIYESSFTLSNTGEFLAITYNNTIIDFVNYTNIDAMEGMSITKQNMWRSTLPTPGYYSNINDTLNITINQTNQQTNQSSYNETINATLNETNITINETYNITNNHTNNSTNKSTENFSNDRECNITLDIKLKEDKKIYYNKEAIKFYNILNVSPKQKVEFYIEYWIEDIYGNILKNKVQTNNLNEKTYTPNINDKTVAATFKNQIINITCEFGEPNILNETSEKIIIIKNPYFKDKECEKREKCDANIGLEQKSQLSTEIKEDILQIDAYRGNDRKYLITTEIKDEKNKNTIKPINIILEKYSGTTIRLPLQFMECGTYNLITNGLGFADKEEYFVECRNENSTYTRKNILSVQSTEEQNKEYSTSQATINAEKNVTKFFHNTGTDMPITGNIIYESKNEKTKRYSLIGIIFLTSTIGIYGGYLVFFKRKKTPKDL